MVLIVGHPQRITLQLFFTDHQSVESNRGAIRYGLPTMYGTRPKLLSTSFMAVTCC